VRKKSVGSSEAKIACENQPRAVNSRSQDKMPVPSCSCSYHLSGLRCLCLIYSIALTAMDAANQYYHSF
jgi:hypothetical protein